MPLAIKGLKYTAALISIYLLVSHATEAGRLLSSGQGAYSGAVKTLQGR